MEILVIKMLCFKDRPKSLRGLSLLDINERISRTKKYMNTIREKVSFPLISLVLHPHSKINPTIHRNIFATFRRNVLKNLLPLKIIKNHNSYILNFPSPGKQNKKAHLYLKVTS